MQELGHLFERHSTEEKELARAHAKDRRLRLRQERRLGKEFKSFKSGFCLNPPESVFKKVGRGLTAVAHLVL